ncbi:uncharacterized protein LOC123657599 [Melitaea cinxia]|uniref:uncharacterized protein LOC123657599 n=1 Tax=Melitaea cinxia TaxID=113334 RepID=UPI001E27383C|nr:uncharacterized protein LOC123657599 [Melitaea cinxia]
MDPKTLVKRRATFKAQLTLFKNYLDSFKNSDTITSLLINELNIRLTKIEELYSEYDDVQSNLENVSEIPEDQFTGRENFESQYFQSIALARELLARHEQPGATGSGSMSVSSTVHGGGPKLKLPTIPIPTFSGQNHDWLEFRDTFISFVHNDNSIPKIHKFHYLRATLKDSAALVIRSLDFSAANYDVAWDLLCDQYNNTRLLVTNHIQSIFNIESIAKESSKALRNIIDIVNKNLRALKTLKLPTEHWDALIVYIISTKLDSVTSHEWETYRNTLKDLPTLKNMITFLNNQADLLETMEDTHTKRRHSDVTYNNRQKSLVVTSNPYSSHINKPYVCPLCKHNHAIYRCLKFRSFSLENRMSKAKSLKLCLNCLRQGHTRNTCKKGPCRVCNKQINSLLHTHKSHTPSESITAHNNIVLCSAPPSAPPPNIVPSSMSSSVLQSTPPSPHSPPETQKRNYTLHDNVALSAIDKNCVLLSTALIEATDYNGKKHTIRALLDNGSTSSFITKNLCDKLNLPTTSISSLVEGLNCQTSCLSKQCNVIMSSLNSTYKEEIKCFIVPRITQLLPITQVDCKSIMIPKGITLADPTYFYPSQVDMLLGADIFWSVLCSNNISLGKNKPTLSETKFVEIHAFSDASTQAYSACVYIKSIPVKDQATINLLTAKSRVAPIKPATVPRLELCGALLAARVQEILDMSEASMWRYVPTHLNPADIGSRGADAKQLAN